MRKALTAAIIAGAAATAACGGQSHDDEDLGAAVSRNYQVGNFTEVEVAGPFDVEIRTGANPSVSARGNEKLIERLEVEVKGNRLVVRPKRDRGWFGGWGSVRGKGSIAVTVPMIHAASLAGSGNLTVNKVTGDSFEGEIAGSGNLRVDTVEVGSLKLGIAGSGNATARAGRAQRAEYEIAGSGGVDARGIAVEDLGISIAGSGGIKAHATGRAKVDIMGSGDVDVTGGAKCSVSKAGSGDVRCS
jgi:Putative auto-transporter adhesin, head GIN domain